MEVKVIDNIFNNSERIVEVNDKELLRNQIEKIDEYKNCQIECYNEETGETYYESLQKEGEATVFDYYVNYELAPENYVPKEGDVIYCICFPSSGIGDWYQDLNKGQRIFTMVAAGSILASLIVGLAVAGVAGSVFSGGASAVGAGFAIGAIIGGIGGGFLGWAAYGMVEDIIDQQNQKKLSSRHDSYYGDKGAQLPDVQGSANQSILNANFPYVFGKHMITPPRTGDAFTEYTGTRGENAYITVLYCLGYGPLKLTDFRLGEILLARNTSTDGKERPTVLCGKLEGTSGDYSNTGAIEDYWQGNEVKLEILQYKGSGPVDYGTLYQYARVPQYIDANTLFIADKTVQELANVIYKGASFPNNFKTNGVFFTASCPKKFTITLDCPNGLFSSVQRSDDSSSWEQYDSIPIWYCIQWRFYDKKNAPSSSDGIDYWDWNNITTFNGTNYGAYFNLAARTADRNAHKGNDLSGYTIEMNNDVQEVSVTKVINGVLERGYRDFDEYRPYDFKDNFGNSLPATGITCYHDVYCTWNENVWVTSAGARIAAFFQNGMNGLMYGYNTKAGPYSGYIRSKFTLNTYSYGILADNVYYIYDHTAKALYIRTASYVKVEEDILHFIGTSNVASSIVIPVEPFTMNPQTRTEFNAVRYDCRVDSCPTHHGGSSYSNYTLDEQAYPNDAIEDIRNNHEGVPYTGEVREIRVFGTYYLANTEVSKNNLYQNFCEKYLCNFQSLSGSDGLSQTRLSATIELTDEQCAELLNADNPTKSIEVRCIRVSPSYLDQTSTAGNPRGYGTYAYSDIIKVSSIVSEPFDEDKYRTEGVIEQLRPLSEKDMKNFCSVAIRVKADAAGRIDRQLQQFNCIAESFAPYWDSENKHIVPENISKQVEYYGYYDEQGNPNYKFYSIEERLVTKSQYEEARQQGFDWVKKKTGSNYLQTIRQTVFANHLFSKDGTVFYTSKEAMDSETARLIAENVDVANLEQISEEEYIDRSGVTIYDKSGTFILSKEAARHNDATCASVFLLSCIGPQCGEAADGYEDIDLLSIADWYENSLEVEDGSKFKEPTFYDGKQYEAGGTVKVHFRCNGVLFQGIKKESFLSKITISGRAIYTYDETGRLRVIMERPVNYVKGVINGQNCISSSNAFDYTDLPAGLRLAFKDENDNYAENSLYCWNDGNTKDNYKGQVEQYNFDYVTDPYQQWLLGRYLLAARTYQRYVLTRKIGREGLSYNIGDVVSVQSDELLIGEGSARIQDVISYGEYIYGFLTDKEYQYTGEVDEDDKIIQGVTIFKPDRFGKSRSVTLRMAAPTVIYLSPNGPITQQEYDEIIDEDEKSQIQIYRLQKGVTNLVLFENPLTHNFIQGEELIQFDVQTGDICMFGNVAFTSAPFRITKIKPESDGTFTETLVFYDENVFLAGAQIPIFKNYASIPPAQYDQVQLSEVPKNLAEMNDANKDILGAISSIKSGTDSTPPDTPVIVSVYAKRDGIEMTAEVVSENLSKSVQYYEWEVCKPGSSPKSVLSTDAKAIYNFDRAEDGYPESFTGWTVRVRCFNIYNQPSEWTEIQSVSEAYYGTWHIPDISVSQEVVDRTIILTASYVGTHREVYGTPVMVARIKKIGNIDTSVESGRSPNEILGITPDEYFYPPEFDLSVVTKVDADNEPNYRKYFTEVETMPQSPAADDIVHYIGSTSEDFTHDKYYQYDGTNWNEINVDYETQSNKLTHTLPLIGQTYRIFKEGNIFTGVFSKDVPDEDEVPVNPQEGDVIRWTGDDRTETPEFKKNSYYLYENNEWISVQSKALIVPTTYEYEIYMKNESGYHTPVVVVAAQALCTNIADIVHSHEFYKDMFVEKLSAISANIGLISQGGMGSFKDALNYWALSDMTAEDSGTLNGVKKGAFRVGGRDQYLLVEPDENDPDKYNITLRAGNINITSEQDQEGFVNGTYIYDGDPAFATKRLALLATGIVAQQYNPTTHKWDNVSRFVMDSRGNLIISNADESKLFTFGFNIPENNGTIYHFDTDAEEDEKGNNPYNISCTGQIVNTEGKNPLLLPESSPSCFEGTVEKDISSFVGTAVFFTKASGIEVDRQIYIDGSTKETYATYNSAMSETKGAGTVGSYLGLSASQISNGIFEEIGE